MTTFKTRLTLAAIFALFLIGGNAEASTPVHCTPETPNATVHPNGVIVCPVK